MLSPKNIKLVIFAGISIFAAILIYISWLSPKSRIALNELKTKKVEESKSSLTEQYDKFIKNLPNLQNIIGSEDLNSKDTILLFKFLKSADSSKNYYLSAVLNQKIAEQSNNNWWRYMQSSRMFIMEAYTNAKPEYGLAFYNQSKINLEKVLELKPKYAPAMIDLALTTKTLNDYFPPNEPLELMKPAKLLLEVVKNEPNNAEAQYFLAKLAIESGQKEKAIERLKKVVSLQPQNRDTYFEISQLYQEIGEKEQSIEWAEKAKKVK